jgi:hypothetical protein
MARIFHVAAERNHFAGLNTPNTSDKSEQSGFSNSIRPNQARHAA